MRRFEKAIRSLRGSNRSGLCRLIGKMLGTYIPGWEQSLYREGIRIQSLAGFFRLQDRRFQATGHKPQKIRVISYLMWDDDHSGSADVGDKPVFRHQRISSFVALDDMEIHPIIKIEVIE